MADQNSSPRVEKMKFYQVLARLGLGLAILSVGVFHTRIQPAQAGWESLTGVLPAYTTISNVLISPDSQYVIFTADIDVEDDEELYSAPLNGGPMVKLNPPLVSGGDVIHREITPDSTRVIYTAEQEVDQRRELYSVPIGGGEAVKLNGALPTGGNVGSFQFDPDSGRVVYIADQDTNDITELYSVPVEGGMPVKLNEPIATGGDVFTFDIDAAGGRVIYSADQDTNDLHELYSVPIAGGTVIKLNQPVASGIHSFSVTPGVAYVMYLAREAGSNKIELFGNDTPGGTPRKRSYTLSIGENVTGFRISPTAMQVVYSVAGNNQYTPGNLWRASPYAGASQRLSELTDPPYGVDGFDYVFAPDGNRVVYRYQKDANSPVKLQSVWVSGGALNRVDLYVPEAGYGIGIYRISPDSQWVVFGKPELTTIASTLHSVPIGGGGVVNFGPGSQPLITHDSQRVIFYRQVNNDHLGDVLSSQIFGGDLRNLTQMTESNYAYSPVLSPDGTKIVFQVQLDGGAGYELRMSDGAEPVATGTPTVTPTGTLTPEATSTPTPTPTQDPDGSPAFEVYIPAVRK